MSCFFDQGDTAPLTSSITFIDSEWPYGEDDKVSLMPSLQK